MVFTLNKRQPPSSEGQLMAADVPKITKSDIPKQARRIFIYADCSASMTGESFNAMVKALNNLWPIADAELFGYSDGMYAVGAPSHLYEMHLGTCFEQLLLHSEQFDPDMALIYSDGLPSDESQTWEVWRRTDLPISTHLCMSPGIISSFPGAVQFMRDLCRGGGTFTCGEEVQDFEDGVSAAMGDETNARRCVSPRRLPDLTPQIRTGVERAKNKAEINKWVIELGDVSVLQSRAAIAGTFEDIFAQVDGMAVEAIDHQREQSQIDKAHRAAAGVSLRDGLVKLGASVLGAVKAGYEQTVLTGAKQRAVAKDTSAAVQIGKVRLDPSVLTRASAILAAEPAKQATALPAGRLREAEAVELMIRPFDPLVTSENTRFLPVDHVVKRGKQTSLAK
jgi:hypothetical protein